MGEDLSQRLRALDSAATQGVARISAASDAYVSMDRPGTLGDLFAGGCGSPRNEAEANAAFICALVNAYRSGDLVPAARLEKAEEALRFYADPAYYRDHKPQEFFPSPGRIFDDQGHRARAALSQTKEPTDG